MSQFRQTGSFYISQWDGDDLNAGTDPTLPKKTIQGLGTGNLAGSPAIVGTGVYKLTSALTGSKYLVGEKLAIVDWNNTAIPIGSRHTGMWYKNFASLGFNTVAESSTNNCIFDSTTNPTIVIRASSATTPSHFRNIFLQDWRQNGNSAWQQHNSIFIGKMNTVTAIGFAYFSNNFADKNSELVLNVTLAPTEIKDNLINCPIRVVGSATLYEAKFLIDGSPRPDADGALPDISAVFANFYSQGNFACEESDVKFIDIISRTVEAGSILLQKSNTIAGYIGGVKVGKKIDLDESGFTITKTGIDDSNPNFWKIATGQPFAKIRITGKVSDSLISAQTLDIRIPFNFDGDAVGGSANNNNVPDAWNARTALDTKGELPNRLTFEVRSSTLTNPGRDVSADWDNDNTNSPSIAGQYYLMEYGQPMLHHIISAVAYGNADANAINAATKLPFNYRSLDIIITITDDREI